MGYMPGSVFPSLSASGDAETPSRLSTPTGNWIVPAIAPALGDYFWVLESPPPLQCASNSQCGSNFLLLLILELLHSLWLLGFSLSSVTDSFDYTSIAYTT